MIKIKILGSGGALRIPRACCNCKICNEARKKGSPYERLGSSLFIENEGILFDTPEDINVELNRYDIKKVSNLFFSHWHPDHTSGIRILESIKSGKPGPINVYLTESLKKDFMQKVSSLFYFEKLNFCRINLIDSISIGKINIKFIMLNNKFAYAFLIQEGNKKVLYCPCHVMHLPLLNELKNIDLLIMNLGFFEGNDSNITGFEKDNLRIVNELNPKKTVLMHIEEKWNKSYEDYEKLEKKYPNIKFSYDGMDIEIDNIN